MNASMDSVPVKFQVADLEPFEESTELLGDPEELRARAERDGYLFFRGLLDPEPILQLRSKVLEILTEHGLRASDADPLDGKLDLARLNELSADQMRVDIGVTADVYTDLQKLPELHRLPHHPSLLDIYRNLFDTDDVFVHPRHIMRAMTSHPATGATPPHQDFPLVQGSTATWTCWFPVGDCRLESGPLVILRGSHREGCLPVGTGDGEGHWTNWGAQLCEHETNWVGGDFAVGDVVMFPSLTVHRSLPAAVRDEVRISMDVRYQRGGDVIEARSLTNHSDRPWDEIYQGWSSENADLMYYWHPDRLSYIPWDDALLEPGARRIC
ncbi:phytanoyl-CoA dioxygenase family protein [Streptomyces sp. NPDC002779]|uniref:phytanoyl-CoA dioxygenase family protein n=1 Tax=Streptomyces sp. NPDC002779 TaxID=3364664 RepID=UPI00369AD9A6